MATDADAQAWVDEVFANSGLVHPNSIDTFFQTMKADGVWAKLDAFQFIRYGGSEIASRICLKRLTTDTRFGGTWTNGAGFNGEGVDDYINTGFNAAVGTPNHTQNSASFGVRLANDINRAGDRAGGTTRSSIGTWSSDVGRLQWDITAGGGIAGSAQSGNRDGFLLVSRTDSTTSKLYRNGSVLDTDSTSSLSVRDAEFYILAENGTTNGGTDPSNFTDNIAECYWIGGGLTDADVTNLNNAIDQYFIDAAAETPVDSLESFENISPADGATGVSITPELIVNNPDSFANLNFRIASDSGFANVIRDIRATTDAVTVADALEYLEPYYWNGRQYTPGGLVDAYLVESLFETDQAGWDGWTTTQMQGTGSFSQSAGQGIVTSDPGGQVGAVFDGDFSDIDENFVVEFTDVTNNLQPSIHFRTQGTSWIGNFIPGYYIYFLGDEVRIGRVTEAGNPSDYSSATKTFVRTADTKYRGRVFAEGYRLRFAIWPVSGSQNGWLIDYTDDVQRFESGGVAVKNAVLAGSSTAEGCAFDYITLQGAQVEQEPESVDSVTVSPTSTTIQPDSTVFITGDIQTSGGLSNAGTWTKVSGDADITIQSQSNNNLTAYASSSVSDNDSAVFELTADEDGTMSAQTTITADVSEPVSGDTQGDIDALEAMSVSLGLEGLLDDWSDTNMSLSPAPEGVTVVNNRVDRIDLFQKGIVSSNGLPSEINNLTAMEYFNVMYNEITGPLPQFNLPNCKYLYLNHSFNVVDPAWELHDKANGLHGGRDVHNGKNDKGAKNKFTGDLYVDCPLIEWLACSWTDISTISVNQLFSNSNFKGLWIGDNVNASNNNYTVPDSIGDMTDLSHITLSSGNSNNEKVFSGQLPTSMSNLIQLHSIRIDKCYFTGVFPDLSGCTQMQTFGISFNRFESGWPIYFIDAGRAGGVVGNLNVFGVSWSGSSWTDAVLPTDIATSIRSLLVNDAGLTGNIPQMPRQMINTNFDNNNFSTITEDWTNLVKIRNTRMRNNPNLTGNIPKKDWLTPSSLQDFTRARFSNTSLSLPSGLEDGREYDHNQSDRGDTGPIVQKTRWEWYEHHCIAANNNKPNPSSQFDLQAP